MFDHINQIINRLKQGRPLVLNITNHVTMDFIANGLLCVGASPVMSHAKQDIEDLIKLASVVVINIGTLDDAFLSLCEQTCRLANALNKPIIFDPVGAGASVYRTSASQRLIEQFEIAIIRGNASEIMALSGRSLTTKGVDSVSSSQSAMESAQELTNTRETTVVISGEMDLIVEADNVVSLTCGSPLMPLVTGTGCLLSAVVGAFHAIEPNRVAAATAAVLFYGVCGEIAARQTCKPGSYKTAFLDALYSTPSRGDYANH